MSKKFLLLLMISLLFLLPLKAQSASILAPPMPARIGGAVTVDGTQLTQATDGGYTFKVTKPDGSDYLHFNNNPAEDTDGLNSADWYIIDIPIYHAADQPGGANQGETALIHVYKNGSELTVTSPANSQFPVGTSGSTTQIDIEAVTIGDRWYGHDLISGDGPQQEPGWSYRTITIDSNGIATYTGTNHNGQTSSGSMVWPLRIGSDSIITNPTDPSAELHGIISDDRKLMVITLSEQPKDQPMLTVYLKREAIPNFSPSDLAGTWRYHGLISGDAPNQTPGWYWGAFTFEQSGTLISATPITDSLGNSDYTPSGPGFNINPDGTITVAGLDGRWVMNDARDMIVGVATMCPGRDTDVCGYNLQIWVKRGMTSFGTADLEGSWCVHFLNAGDSPQWTGWGYGPFSIDSYGNYAGSIQYSDHSTDTPNGTLTVINDGIVTEVGNPETHGVISEDKKLMIFTGSNGPGDYGLFVFTKRGAPDVTRPNGEGGGGGGGCFISTVICDLSMELGFSPVVTLALGVLLVSLVGFGAGMSLKRRRIHCKP